jgi:hypothetical protein
MEDNYADEFDPTSYMDNLDVENKNLRQRNFDMASALSASNMPDVEDQNLIQFQLETDKILERIEHFLKGDQIKFNKNGAYFAEPTKNVLALKLKDPKSGVIYYIQEKKENKKGSEYINRLLVKIRNKNKEEVNVLEQDSHRIMEKVEKMDLINLGYKYIEIIDEDKKPLNEYGVAEMMRIISMYVTKETFLSRYSEERIYEIMGDLGDAINNFMYCNYEKMGMDTKFKESKYIVICLNIFHTIESCYRRAISGAEQENLRTRAIVTQSQGFSRPSYDSNIVSVPHKKWHPLKPSTW